MGIKAAERSLTGLALALVCCWNCTAALADGPAGVSPAGPAAAGNPMPGSLLPNQPPIPPDEPPPTDTLMRVPNGPNTTLPAGEEIVGPAVEGPLLPEGQVIPPTLSTRDWFTLHNYYGEYDVDVLGYGNASRGSREIIDQADVRFFDRTDLKLGIAAGAKITIGSYLGADFNDRDHSLEATFEGLNSWTFNGRINSAAPSVLDNGGPNGTFGSLITTINFPDSAFFNGADFYKIVYHSTMNSLETNVRIQSELGQDQLVYNPDTGTWVRHVERGPQYALLFGLRYLNLNERANLTAGLNETTGTIQGFPVADFGGSYNVNVDNNLAGLNFGGDLNYQYEKWWFGFDFRAAPCLNFASNTADIFFNDPALTPQHFSASKTTTGFISEIGFSAAYQISRRARLKFTYSFEWLTNVGQAPSQFNLPGPNGPAQVNTSNGVFLNGLDGGLEVIW